MSRAWNLFLKSASECNKYSRSWTRAASGNRLSAMNLFRLSTVCLNSFDAGSRLHRMFVRSPKRNATNATPMTLHDTLSNPSPVVW